jgi:uncharacterized protein (DUF924 family)
MIGPEDVLEFWLDEVGPEGWFKSEDALDETIRTRFADAWQGAMEGRYSLWLTYPSGTLAYVILTDQFPRNMFRGTARAFASDRVALAAAKSAVNRRWDLKIDAPARVLFYMPLEHSESLTDQDRAVRLICERLAEHRQLYLIHALAHREVIRQFGRFPFRNAALGRATTQAEQAFLDAGGYGHTLRALEMKQAS